MNPYSTNRARNSWQNGYEGKPLSILDWPECYQHGVNAKRAIDNLLIK
jgi:hypothetical protein